MSRQAAGRMTEARRFAGAFLLAPAPYARLLKELVRRDRCLWVGTPEWVLPMIRRPRWPWPRAFLSHELNLRLGRLAAGDPCGLPWHAETFDCVVCQADSLDRCSDRLGEEKALAEVARVVRQDGRIVLVGSPTARVWSARPVALVEEAPPATLTDDGTQLVVFGRAQPRATPTDGALVNLGCGDDRRAGWVNVDIRPVGEVVASVTQLPFAGCSVARLAAQDVLEHFWRDEHGSILNEWRRVLKPGGLLEVRVPNLEGLSKLLLRGELMEDVLENVYGGHRFGSNGEFDTHHWSWVPRTLERDLLSAGFVVESNDRELNMRVTARAMTHSFNVRR